MPALAMQLAQRRASRRPAAACDERAERHLLAVLRGAGMQRVERVADQVLGARARPRGAGDLHRQAAQHEPAQQPVQELGLGRAARRGSPSVGRVDEVGRALRQQRGEVVDLLAARPPPRSRQSRSAQGLASRSPSPARARSGGRRARSPRGRPRPRSAAAPWRLSKRAGRRRGSRSPARRCRRRSAASARRSPAARPARRRTSRRRSSCRRRPRPRRRRRAQLGAAASRATSASVLPSTPQRLAGARQRAARARAPSCARERRCRSPRASALEAELARRSPRASRASSPRPWTARR